MNEKLKEVFLGAYALIKDKNKWTTQAIAEDHRGEACLSYEEDATCWCSGGAIERAGLDLGYVTLLELKQSTWVCSDATSTQLMMIFDKYIQGGGIFKLITFNDTNPYDEVVALWEIVGKGEGFL